MEARRQRLIEQANQRLEREPSEDFSDLKRTRPLEIVFGVVVCLGYAILLALIVFGK